MENTQKAPARVNENFRLRVRADGIWEVVWDDLETGKQRRKSTGTREKSDASVQLAQIAAEARAPKIAAGVTVGDLIGHYLKAADADAPQEDAKARHRVAALRASLKPVRERLGALRWDQLTQNEIDAYGRWRMSQDAWAGHKTKKTAAGKKVGPSTVNKDLRMLRAVLNDSHARRYIPTPVAFRINVSAPSGKDDYLTREEVKRMLDACEVRETVRDKEGKVIARHRDREHIRAFILISLATAARKEAVLTLRWDQVHIPKPEEAPEGVFDWSSGKVSKQAYIDFGEGRGNKRRPKIPVGNNPGLMSYLLWGGDKSQPYVITYRGQPIDDIKKVFAEILSEVGITKKITPHSMKHTAITWMVQAGMKLETISDLTNTSVKILRKHYSHHRPDYAAEIGDALSV